MGRYINKMSPEYNNINDLVNAYKLEPVNCKYYDMDLYKDKRGVIHAIQYINEKCRIYLSWNKPISPEVLENEFTKAYRKDK